MDFTLLSGFFRRGLLRGIVRSDRGRSRRGRNINNSQSRFVENLEDRRLLAADLRITEAYLVDGRGVRITAPVFGERVAIRADFSTTDLPSNANYTIGFSVNGVNLNSAALTLGSGLASATGGWIRSGWMAAPGSHSVVVTIDNQSTISEADESNNVSSFSFSPVQQTDFPHRLIVPIGGRTDVDWTTVNYLDVDPRSGFEKDYLGGPFEYDGHDAWDLTIPTFGLMDRGITIMAAAPGTVIEVSDGNYDREIAANQRTANFIRLDHGNGWTTNYWHLATNTTTVKVGDSVSAGQVLGLVGSSGSSTDAHVHFNLNHHGYEVETAYAPADYHAVAPVYQGNQSPVVLASGITNYNFTTEPREFRESPSAVGMFSTSGNDSVRFWYRLSHLNTGATIRMRFLRPDGSVAASVNRTATSIERFSLWNYLISPTDWRQYPGTWNAAVDIGGVELARSPFEVVVGVAPPEARLRLGTEPISDGRTTAVDFGTVARNASTPELTLSVENHGGSTLTISGVQLPPGFATVGTVPSSVPAGGSTSLTLRMLTADLGRQFGEVRILTNDVDEAIYNFNVGGVITGSPVADAPTLTSTAPAAVVYSWTSPAIVNSSLSVGDPNGSLLSGSELIAELSSGRQPSDVLGVRNQGLGSQQVGLSGESVLYGGVTIGKMSGGTNGIPLRIVFDSNASLTAITAVARNLTFQDGGGVGGVRRRVVAVSFRDSQSLQSPKQYTTIIYPDSVPPTNLTLPDNAVPENSPVGTTVGIFSTTSTDVNSPHFYQLVSGIAADHNSLFTIVGNELRTAAQFNFEQTASYSIRVRTTNPGGFSIERPLTVVLTNVNESPSDLALSPASLPENGAVGTTVGTFTATDPDSGDNGHTLQLVAGQADNSSFLIDGNSLKAAATFDFEAKSSYSVLVETVDAGGLTFQKTLTVSITNINETPTGIQLSSSSVAENLPSGSTVGTLTSSDVDAGNSHQWSLVSGAGDTDNALFTVVGSQLKTTTLFNFESKPQRSIRVRTTDQGGLSIDQVFTINVLDGNDAPTSISLSNDTIAENQPAATFVGNLAATDPDVENTHTFSLVNGTGSEGNLSFRIVGNQLQISDPLNFEAQATYSIRVQALDQSGLAFQTIIVISVTDVNDAPTGIVFTDNLLFLRETLSTASGVRLARILVTDDALGTNQLSLSGMDANVVELKGTELWLKSGTPLNALTKSTFVVSILADDSSMGGTPDTSAEFRINVTSEVPRIYAPVTLTPEIRPVFRWTPVGGATNYEVWLDNRTTGVSRYNSGTTSQTSFTPTRDLPIGTYNLWVRAAGASWSALYTFRINTAVTIKPIPASINNSRPTLEWNALAGAAKYDFWLDNLSTGQTQLVRTQTLTTASWTPTSDLPLGTYRMWVRGIDASGLSAAWSMARTFSVNTAVTIKPIPAFINNSRPTLEWNTLAGAAKYELWMDNISTGQTEFVRTQTLTTNSWTPTTDLPIGAYRVWVRGINASGSVGSWSNAVTFGIATAPSNLRPDNSIFNRRPNFTWKSVTGAVRYHFILRNVSTGHELQNLPSLTSTSWTPTANMAAGQYQWTVTAVSSQGVRSFVSTTISLWIGGRPELLGPSQSTTSRTPTFTWKPVSDAVRYELYVILLNVQGGVLSQTNLTQASFTPTTPLAVGQYRFWVRSVSATEEFSLWSEPKTFTIVSTGTPAGIESNSLISALRSKLAVAEMQCWSSTNDAVQVVHDSQTAQRDLAEKTIRHMPTTDSEAPHIPGLHDLNQVPDGPDLVRELDQLMIDLAMGSYFS